MPPTPFVTSHFPARHPRLLSVLLYVSLLLSTALQFTFGPEATLRLAGFYTSDLASRDAEFRAWYPDFGSLGLHEPTLRALKHGELWKFSSFWPDAAYYVRQVKHPSQSVPPYKYRFLPTVLVGALSASTGLGVELAFVLFNLVAAVLTAVLFEAYLQRFFGFSQVMSTLGGCLFVASVGNTGTLAFPMLEPASALCSCLIFIAVAARHPAGFVCAAIAGVATKEILVFASLLWWLNRPAHEPTWKCGAVAAVPILAFIAIRSAFGGHALEVNYGFDVWRGEFPAYGRRLLSLRSSLNLAVQTFMAFSFTWLGLMNAGKQPLLRRSLPVIPLVILAAFLLSSRITRVLGVLFPIVLPAFLLFFDEAARASTRRQERVDAAQS